MSLDCDGQQGGEREDECKVNVARILSMYGVSRYLNMSASPRTKLEVEMINCSMHKVDLRSQSIMVGFTLALPSLAQQIHSDKHTSILIRTFYANDLEASASWIKLMLKIAIAIAPWNEIRPCQARSANLHLTSTT